MVWLLVVTPTAMPLLAFTEPAPLTDVSSTIKVPTLLALPNSNVPEPDLFMVVAVSEPPFMTVAEVPEMLTVPAEIPSACTVRVPPLLIEASPPETKLVAVPEPFKSQFADVVFQSPTPAFHW